MGVTRAVNVRKQKRQFHRSFLTRAQACRKLGVRIRDFRRLCILKGIYPRHPKNIPDVSKKAGLKAGSTFYFAADINWLLEDNISRKIQDYKTYGKKLQKHIGRGDLVKGKTYKKHNKPEYALVETVKERYPTFLEAVREMDDALCHVFLYGLLPAHLASNTSIEGHGYLTTQLSEKSLQLMSRWNKYISESQSLRKSFISIKGFYFQADIIGQTVTWLVPHNYNTHMPPEVDYHTMITFLEFYAVMLDFILFRLEHELKATKDNAKVKEEAKLDAEDADENPEENTEDFPMSPEDQKEKDAKDKCVNLFKGFKFSIGSEVPQANIILAIEAFGGKYVREQNAKSITHHIMDRPTIANKVDNRDYVQPQWVIDCINCKHLLPVDQYAPGKELPPHLSPFEDGLVADHEGKAYEPARLREIQKIMDPTFRALTGQKGEGEEEVEDDMYSDMSDISADEAERTKDGVVTDDDATDDEDESAAKKEGESTETAGETAEPTEKSKEDAKKLAEKRKAKKEMDEKKMRSLLLSGKKRKLWEQITRSHAIKDKNVRRLDERRIALEAGKLQIVKGKYVVDTESLDQAKAKKKLQRFEARRILQTKAKKKRGKHVKG